MLATLQGDFASCSIMHLEEQDNFASRNYIDHQCLLRSQGIPEQPLNIQRVYFPRRLGTKCTSRTACCQLYVAGLRAGKEKRLELEASLGRQDRLREVGRTLRLRSNSSARRVDDQPTEATAPPPPQQRRFCSRRVMCNGPSVMCAKMDTEDT